jgi:SP family general alpha glucoside:H+ symporter-like MFS transporter
MTIIYYLNHRIHLFFLLLIEIREADKFAMSQEKNANSSHVENADEEIPPMTDFVINEAKEATKDEHDMSLLRALKLYPKAAGWSILLSTALVMEGFDNNIIGSFYAFPTFVQKYGSLTSNGTYQVSASWQAGLSNGVGVGEILGLFGSGVLSERYGYRKTLMGAHSLLICFIFITFFAPNIKVLLVGEMLCGLCW